MRARTSRASGHPRRFAVAATGADSEDKAVVHFAQETPGVPWKAVFTAYARVGDSPAVLGLPGPLRFATRATENGGYASLIIDAAPSPNDPGARAEGGVRGPSGRRGRVRGTRATAR